MALYACLRLKCESVCKCQRGVGELVGARVRCSRAWGFRVFRFSAKVCACAFACDLGVDSPRAVLVTCGVTKECTQNVHPAEAHDHHMNSTAESARTRTGVPSQTIPHICANVVNSDTTNLPTGALDPVLAGLGFAELVVGLPQPLCGSASNDRSRVSG